MAFTAGEFVRGVVLAWALFALGTLPVTAAFSAIVGGDPGRPAENLVGSGLVAVGAAVVALLVVLTVGWPLGLALGLLLRRVRPRGAHVAAFAALGLVLAYVGIAALFAATGTTSGGDVPPLVSAVQLGLPFVGLAGVASGAGWAITASLALRADRRTAQAPEAPGVSEPPASTAEPSSSS